MLPGSSISEVPEATLAFTKNTFGIPLLAACAVSAARSWRSMRGIMPAAIRPTARKTPVQRAIRLAPPLFTGTLLLSCRVSAKNAEHERNEEQRCEGSHRQATDYGSCPRGGQLPTFS